MHLPFAEILFFLFILWAVSRLFSRTTSDRRLGRHVGLPPYPTPRHSRELAPDAARRCPDPRCRHQNPSHAHFCAQCGRRLATEESNESSMWVES